MSSFLITFKPQTENPQQGWPVSKLKQLASRVNSGQDATERWRFRSYKAAKRGDRVFLLQQGRKGPAIIGYGWIAEAPTVRRGFPTALIEFEEIVNPNASPLIDRGTLKSIAESDTLWNTQTSGIRIPDSVAIQLENLVAEKLDLNSNNSSKEAGHTQNAIDDLGSDTPDRELSLVWIYSRDPKVRAEVLRRADGKCEYCGVVGFLKKDGTRYLECHHIIALANDGEDRLTNVIALCPNHHREAHFGRDSAELEERMIQRLRILIG